MKKAETIATITVQKYRGSYFILTGVNPSEGLPFKRLVADSKEETKEKLIVAQKYVESFGLEFQVIYLPDQEKGA